MVTGNAKIIRIKNSIQDKEIKKIFSKEDNSEGRNYPPEFMRAHEKSLRALLPSQYDEMLNRYDKLFLEVRHVAAFLESYIAIEYKIVDCNVLETVKNIKTINADFAWQRSVLNSAYYEKGIKAGRFTAKDVLSFTERNPEYLDFFLPLLAGCDDAEIWEKLNGYVKNAKLEDTLRFSLFRAMLGTGNVNALSYYLGEIEKNNYYRFKVLGEVTVEMGDYDCNLPPKQTVAVLKDVVQGKQKEYLAKSFKESYYFQRALDRISHEEFSRYIRLVLSEGAPNARHALLHNLNMDAVCRNYTADIFTGQLSLEDYSFFHHRVDCKWMNRDVLPVVFDRLLTIYDGMDKVNYHYKTNDDVSFARDVSKKSLVGNLAEAAIRLNDRKYIDCLDARYDSFKEDAQGLYLRTVGDRTKLDRRACAVRFLKTDNFDALTVYDKMKIVLTYDEAVLVSDFLKTKKQSIKTKIVKEFLASPDQDKICEYLLHAKEDYKVSVGKEMQNAADKVARGKLKEFSEYSRYQTNECVFTLQEPRSEIDKITSQTFPAFRYKGVSLKRLKNFFDRLSEFVERNKNYEYKAWIGEGMDTFGSHFYALRSVRREEDKFINYPLGKDLKTLFQSCLTGEELASLLLLISFHNKSDKIYYSAVYGKKLIGDQTGKLYAFLNEIRKPKDQRNYLYNMVTMLYSAILNELISVEIRAALNLLFTRPEFFELEKKENVNSYRIYGRSLWGAYVEVWQDSLRRSRDEAVLKVIAYTLCMRLKNGLPTHMSLNIATILSEKKIISPELLRYIIIKDSIWLRQLTDEKSALYLYRAEYPYPAFKEYMLELIDDSVNAELTRGNLATPYNTVVRSINRIAGATYFVRAIAAIRGLTIVRSPFGSEKNESISMIMKYSVKAESDTYEKFVALLEEYKITREELVRATLFNPAFIDYAAKYLAIPYFKLAVYYFIAHLNDSISYGEEGLYARRIETIKEFSDINYLDFKDGAFDYEWYKEMVEKVPAKDLKLIYENAKYVTVGGLHKRAQRFFDAMNGKITKAECLEKMTGTRNKDYCLIYSLIPISDKQDLRDRYLVLQDFLKESKKYGAQRQLSERRTVDLALENLARAAGYADTNLFIFEIEADYPHDIYKTYVIDEVEITPEIVENSYKVSYKVTKNGKKISSIPSKYAKNETVLQLKEEIKQLNQKFKRIAKSFEAAMCNGIPFTPEQLKHMSRERTIETVLSHLLFLSKGKLAVFKNGVLTDFGGKEIVDGEVYVAHPVQLKKADLLTEAIGYIVKNNVKQPFQQVLREIYMKSETELLQEEVLRFKGFNVDLKKCISALKGKGWGTSEDIGLRKVFYRSDTVAALFRKFDELYLYDFENVERELHGIYFLNRKTEEIIPLKSVDDVTFSETLRDVDLMITISANAIYDYDLAKSTVEIRHEILRSIISILGLKNVSFLKDNISVKGTYGTYIINIRTGLVFKEGKGNLLLDTVYSTNKPLLLDFIDEDPMTADIISKALILSNDQAIRDPYILREIKDF